MQKCLQAAGPDPLCVDALRQNYARLLFGRAELTQALVGGVGCL